MIVGKGPTYSISTSFGLSEKGFTVSFSKANTTFCLRVHCYGDTSFLIVNGKEIFKFKADNKNINFLTRFCLESYPIDLVLLSLEKHLRKCI